MNPALTSILASAGSKIRMISDPDYWIDASQLNLADGASVPAGNELSSNGYAYTTSGSPQYSETLPDANNKPTIIFGTNGWLQTAGVQFGKFSTVFMVVSYRGTSDWAFDSAGTGNRHIAGRNNAQGFQMHAGSTVYTPTSAQASGLMGTTTPLLAQASVFNETNSYQYANYIKGGTASVGAMTFDGVTVGRLSNSNSTTGVYISEFLIYSRILTDVEVVRNQEYLIKKWEIQV